MTQELYELPEGWANSNIGAVAAKLITGKTPSKKIEAYYAKPEILWFTPSDFAGQALLTDSKRKLDQQAVDDGVIKLAEPYTVMLVAIGATIGKVGINSQAAFFNQQITGIQFSQKIDPKYAYYWLTYIKPEILQNAGQATLPIINQKGIKELSFIYPNLPEQQRLVKKLDALLNRIDTAIEHLEHSLELNDQLFASSLNQAFNPLQLDAEIQSDGTYQLPEGWEWKTLEQVTEKTKNLNPAFFSEDYWSYIDISSINNSIHQIIDPKKILGKEAPSRAKKQVENKDVLFATTRPNLKNIAVVENADAFTVASTGFCVLRANETTSSGYLFFYMLSEYVQQQILKYISGANYPAITDTNLKKTNVPIPAKHEQENIVATLEQIHSKTQVNKQVLQQKLEQLQQLKASLLDSAFRGEL